MRRVLLGCLMAIGLLVLGSAAWAAPIGPDCGSCNGGIYSLTYSESKQLPDSNGASDFFLITYHMDLTGFTPSQADGAFVHGVAFKLGSDSILGATLTSAPNGVAAWNVPSVDEQINNGGGPGCGGGGNGWICTDYATTLGVDFTGANPKVLDWTFRLEVTEGSTPNEYGSIKAIFVNNDGQKIGDILSEAITGTPQEVVPGPAPLALVGLGVVGLALSRVRRQP